MKKSPKILIIDDEAPIRASLREILEYEDFLVSEAEDGAEGVKLAGKFAFDVIFCDIKMPKMDGLEVLEILMEKGTSSRVIMISGHGTVETAVQAIKQGAFDFIQKPLDLNRILLTVRHALDQGQLEAETERLKMPGMSPARARLIPLSSMLLQNVLNDLPPTARVMRSPHALREGVMHGIWQHLCKEYGQ